MNKTIFQKLIFFKELTLKTQLILAENLVNKIVYAEEIHIRRR